MRGLARLGAQVRHAAAAAAGAGSTRRVVVAASVSLLSARAASVCAAGSRLGAAGLAWRPEAVQLTLDGAVAAPDEDL